MHKFLTLACNMHRYLTLSSTLSFNTCKFLTLFLTIHEKCRKKFQNSPICSSEVFLRSEYVLSHKDDFCCIVHKFTTLFWQLFVICTTYCKYVVLCTSFHHLLLICTSFCKYVVMCTSFWYFFWHFFQHLLVICTTFCNTHKFSTLFSTLVCHMHKYSTFFLTLAWICTSIQKYVVIRTSFDTFFDTCLSYALVFDTLF